MRDLQGSAITLWMFCVWMLISIASPQLTRADVCQPRPSDNKSDYPTEQPLYFDLQVDAVAGADDVRIVRARLSGSDMPVAKLKVYPRQEEKKRSLLTITVVPIIITDREANELVASLDVAEMKLSPLLPELRFEEIKAKVEEALRGWEKRLIREQKEEIQKNGTLDLIPDLDSIEGVSPRAPLSVVFVTPIKNPLDLYDIAKGLEYRLGKYGKLEREYSRVEGSRLEDGLAALDELNRKLALFDVKLTSEFESVVRLQKEVASRRSSLTVIQKDLATAWVRQREIRKAPVPTRYVNVDMRRTSSLNKSGFQPLDDALSHAKKVDQNLYQSQLDNLNNKNAQRLYYENLSKLDWLKKMKEKYKKKSDQKQKKDMDQIRRTIANLEKKAASVKDKYRNLNREKAEVLSRLRAYYQRLTSNIDDDKSAPSLESIKADKQAENVLYSAMDWINNQAGYLKGERDRIDQELGQHIEQLLVLDRRLAVLGEDIAEHRQQAACWVIKALKKGKDDDLIDVLSDFNKLAGDLNDVVSNASGRADKLDKYVRDIFLDYKTDWLGKFGKRIGILSKSAERIKSWSGPAEKLLVLNQQFEDKDPKFFVNVLKGAGDIAGKVPVIGSTIKMFLDYNAFLSDRILTKAYLVHNHLTEQAIELLLSDRNLPPWIQLYSANDVREVLSHNASDAEVQEVATELQIKRIKHLLAKGSKSRGLPKL